MLKDLQAPAGTKIGLESGTQMYLVCRILVAAGMDPVVIDAAEVRAKIHRSGQKSDYRDAFAICDGLRNDIYNSIVYVADEKVLLLRRILSRRRHFVSIRASQINAVKFVLRSNGLGHLVGSLSREAAWKNLLTYAREKPEIFTISDALTLPFSRNKCKMHSRISMIRLLLA